MLLLRVIWLLGDHGNPFQPDFAPPRINAAWAEHAVVAVPRPTEDIVQNYRRGFQGLHHSGLLVDEFFHAPTNTERATAIRHEFCVKHHAAVLVVVVNSRADFLIRLDANKFARLKVEHGHRAGPADGQFSAASREGRTAPERLNSIVEPAGRAAKSVALGKRPVIVTDIDKATNNLPQRRVTRRVVF